MNKRIIFSCFLALYLVLLTSCTTYQSSLTENLKVSFLAFGDSGYVTTKSHGSGLLPVANAMKQYCAQQGCDFGLAAGDNIYSKGADGNPNGIEDKKRFETLFLNPYGDFQKHTNSEFRLYMAMGNHDWYNSRAGALAQLKFHETTPPFYMDGLFYRVKPKSGKGRLEIFVVDTEMLLAPLQYDKVQINDAGQALATGKLGRAGTPNALPQTDQEQDQLQWLEDALRRSTAKWKIVVGHHPLWESKGSKYPQAELIRPMLLPMLCQYADAYFAGHQHTLEVHEDSCETVISKPQTKPLLHVVSGAAAKMRSITPEFKKWLSANNPQLNNLWAVGNVWGFNHVTINDDRLLIKVVTVDQKNGETTEVFSHSFENRD